ncbi:MAG TPA: DUF3060 domain-containing protein [Sphingobium sp.]
MRALPCYQLALIGLLTMIGLLAPASIAQAQMRFEGAGQQTALDCGGGTIHIAGASNRLTIVGACTELQVDGADNQIRIDLAAQSGVSIQGANNRIYWTAPAAARPRLSISGTGNGIHRLKQAAPTHSGS